MSDVLKKILDDANEEFSVAFKNAPLGMDWSEFDEYFKPYHDKIDKASRDYRLSKVPSFKKIPKYGDRMSLKDFIECCNDGGFIDYDGSGNYVKDNLMSDIAIYPSDVDFDSIRKDFDEIVWFNK